MDKKYKNIFWFLIDGLRPDFLHIKSEREDCNFIDQLLLKGTVFDNVVTAGAGTHTSMHAIFTGLMPSYNGAVGCEKSALRNFKQEIFTLADYFQLAGYDTFRFGDADLERACPMTGFKRWEGSGYHIGKILEYTDLTKAERRNRFIEDVNICSGNKFVYHHSLLLHDLNGRAGTFWSSEDYAKNIEITAKEFKKLYCEYCISEDDLVIIASDHGVLLNRDYIHDLGENFGHHHEESVTAFFALIGKNIPSQILSEPVSALDEAPTLLQLTLGEAMPGQGKDRCGYIYRGEYQPAVCYRESGVAGRPHSFEQLLNTNFYYLRDGKWKYTFNKQHLQCEWLIDLESGKDFQVNLKDQYPEIANRYREMIKREFFAAEEFQYQSCLGLDKADVPKEFSLILQVNNLKEQTVESLLDMSGPYYEILLPASARTAHFQDQYKVRFMDTLDEESVQTFSRGKWLVYLKENGEYSEYFLSDLYRYIQHHRKTNVKIVGEHYTAVRKGEKKAWNDLELHEEKQVRTIRYLDHEERQEKYILFGCGAMGKEAVYYFGWSNVYCFVDNDPDMVGREIVGKKVISVQELKKIHSSHKIVITAAPLAAWEIGTQLAKEGILDFLLLKERCKEKQVTCWEDEFRLVKPEEWFL